MTFSVLRPIVNHPRRGCLAFTRMRSQNCFILCLSLLVDWHSVTLIYIIAFLFCRQKKAEIKIYGQKTT